MADTKKKAKKMLSSFTILFIILLVVALASVIVSMVAPDSGVVAANLSSFTMARCAALPMRWMCACSLWCWAASWPS